MVSLYGEVLAVVVIVVAAPAVGAVCVRVIVTVLGAAFAFVQLTLTGHEVAEVHAPATAAKPVTGPGEVIAVAIAAGPAGSPVGVTTTSI